MSFKHWALFSGLLLLFFLLLRPVVGHLGEPDVPNIKGQAAPVKEHVPSLDDAMVKNRKVPTPADTRDATDMADVEKYILLYTNQERTGKGLTALQAEMGLTETARLHNRDMMARKFFEHVNPDGLGPDDRIAQHHRTLVGLTGENIWMAQNHPATDEAQLAKAIVDGWMNSPGHRANILRQDYTHLGVGVTRLANGIWATQNFAFVASYLDSPLPSQAKPGDVFDLDMVGKKASMFDLWSVSKGRSVIEGAQLGSPLPGLPSAPYRLRLYFLNNHVKNQYMIFYGPDFTLRSP